MKRWKETLCPGVDTHTLSLSLPQSFSQSLPAYSFTSVSLSLTFIVQYFSVLFSSQSRLLVASSYKLNMWGCPVELLVPGGGAGVGAVSWLCTWWRQVAGAGAGCRCWCWVPGSAGAGAARGGDRLLVPVVALGAGAPVLVLVL